MYAVIIIHSLTARCNNEMLMERSGEKKMTCVHKNWWPKINKWQKYCVLRFEDENLFRLVNTKGMMVFLNTMVFRCVTEWANIWFVLQCSLKTSCLFCGTKLLFILSDYLSVTLLLSHPLFFLSFSLFALSFYSLISNKLISLFQMVDIFNIFKWLNAHSALSIILST